MAETSKLELILLAKDKMSPALQKLLSLLKKTQKDGKSSTDAVDKLTKKLERAPKTDGLKKATGELKKTATASAEAAKAAEKLNIVRKRGQRNSTAIAQEIADTKKLGEATNDAAKAEEKLNSARKRGYRRSNGGSPSNPNSSGDGQSSSTERKSPRGNSGDPRSLEDDIVEGGTGAAMIFAAKKGLGAAMSQQEAFTDIYNSFYRSTLSQKEMNGQMEKAEEISIRLGNKLKGNTADFATMLSTMKQSGMEATTILDGAGEAAAYLAVANREDYSEVGKNYAKFGQLFEIKGKDDNLKIADLISRAKGKGLSSEDLITASKYFGGRTAKTMGLTGAKGAEDVLRFMTFVQQHTALDPSSVGTGSSAFFRAFTKDEKKKTPIIPQIEQKTGVKLDLFDDKGQFKGLENAVAKFAQLKGKLSDKESLQFGQELAGDEGAAILGAMIEAGNAYKKENADLDQMAGMMDKAAKESNNLSNKVEALTGSLENLGAEGFKPLLGPLGSLTDKSNDAVGALTDYAKTHPILAATTASVVTLGGAYLGLRAGSGILSKLSNMTALLGNNAASSTSRVAGLGSKLGGLPTALKIGLTMELIGFTWDQITTLRATIDEWKKTQNSLDTGSAALTKAYKASDEAGIQPDYKSRAKDAMFALEGFNKDFSKALDPKKLGWTEWFGRGVGSLVGKDTNLPLYQGKPTELEIMKNPQYAARVKQVQQMPFKQGNVENAFSDAYERVASEIAAVRNLQNRAPMLADPNTMSAFRRDALPSMDLSDVKRQFVEQLLSSAFPQSYAESSQQMSQNSSLLSQSFSNMIQPTTSVADQMLTLNNNSTQAVTGVNNLANATGSAANRINSLQFTAPTFAPIRLPILGQSPSLLPPFGGTPIGRAKGGSVRRGNAYQVGEVGREMFVPETNGSIISNDLLRSGSRRSGGEIVVNFNPTVNVNSDNPNAAAIVEDVRREMAILKKELAINYSPDRLAQKVEWAAQRDSERT